MENNLDFNFPLQPEDLLKETGFRQIGVKRLIKLEDEEDHNGREIVDHIINELRFSDPHCIREQSQFDGIYSLIRKIELLSISKQSQFLECLNTNLKVLVTSIDASDSSSLNLLWVCLKLYIYFLCWTWLRLRVDNDKLEIADTDFKNSKSKRVGSEVKDNDKLLLKNQVRSTISAFLLVVHCDLESLFKNSLREFLLNISKFLVRVILSINFLKSQNSKNEAFDAISRINTKFKFSSEIAHLIIESVSEEDNFGPVIESLTKYSVENYQDTSIVKGFIDNFMQTDPVEYSIWWETSKGKNSTIKKMAKFLETLGWSFPALVRQFLPSLDSYWICRAYVLRSALIDVTCACLEDAPVTERSDIVLKQKMLDRLMERFMDVSAYTRSRCLQAWARLSKNKEIPIGHLCEVARLAKERLNDKSSIVRKSAISLLKTLVEYNPFMENLQISRLRSTLEEFKIKMEHDNKSNLNGGSGSMGEEENVGIENNEEIEKIQSMVASLETATLFSETIGESLSMINTLLISPSHPLAQEAIAYIVVCKNFAIEGIDKILKSSFTLIFKGEEFAKDVLNALKTLYIKSDPLVAARNLVRLTAGASLSELECLRTILKVLLESRDLIGAKQKEQDEFYTDILKGLLLIALKKDMVITGRESGGEKEQDERVDGALFLLSQCLPYRVEFAIKSIDIFLKIGFVEYSTKGIVVSHICNILKNIGKFNIPNKNQNDIYCALIQVVFDTAIPEFSWYQACESAINAIYALFPCPEELFSEIIQKMASELSHGKTLEEEAAGDHEMMEENQRWMINTKKLSHFFFVVGHVAMQQILYVESCISDGKKKSKEKHKAEDKEEKIVDDDDGDDISKQVGYGSQAIDITLDNLKEKLEDELFGTKSLFGTYAPLISNFCSDTKKLIQFPLTLTASGTTALVKLAAASKEFCRNNLSVIFNLILCDSLNSDIKKSLVISLGDLVLRFPNLLAPYTPHIFGFLDSTCFELRYNCLLVLKHLVLNEMIKIRGHISKIALLLEDKEKRIRQMAKRFFYELSKKSERNSSVIYNYLPEILSKLLEEDNLSTDAFERIIKQIFKLITKEKQNSLNLLKKQGGSYLSEKQITNLVEKLCLRFEHEKRCHIWRGLSFCLRTLNLGVSGFQKLVDMTKYFKHSLINDSVLANFKDLLGKLKRNEKFSDLKESLNDFESYLFKIQKDLTESSTDQDHPIEVGKSGGEEEMEDIKPIDQQSESSFTFANGITLQNEQDTYFDGDNIFPTYDIKEELAHGSLPPLYSQDVEFSEEQEIFKNPCIPQNDCSVEMELD